MSTPSNNGTNNGTNNLSSNHDNNQQKTITAETIAQAMLKKHQQKFQLAQGKSSSTGQLKVGPFARIKENEKKRTAIPTYDSDDDNDSPPISKN